VDNQTHNLPIMSYRLSAGMDDLRAPRGALLYSPCSGHGLEEVSLDLMADPWSERWPGTIACQETGSRAQAYGTACREIRAIRRKPDCL